jgi:translation initiation factor 6
MSTILYRIKNSDYVGVFATASDRYVFLGSGIEEKDKQRISDALGVESGDRPVSSSDLVGLFARANSNGIILSNLVETGEIERLESLKLGINIGIIDSGLNTVGNNIIANDKIAVVNPDYDSSVMAQIGDILGVEVVKSQLPLFKTIGASNIFTNRGMVINNRSSDTEKAEMERISKSVSVRTTANSGSIYVGLSAIANSKGIVAGKSTTGFEMQRLTEGLDIEV